MPENVDSVYDCAIIGGGPAGLTCAIFMARYRRRTLLVDSGKPRNYASQGVHGFLGHHGILPAELNRKGREEAAAAGAEICEAIATKIEKLGDVFEVTTNVATIRARRVVLAYGVRDILPDIPGIEEYYGKSIHHCPDCDGYEVSDRRVGVIGWGKRVVGFTLKMLRWTCDLTIFTHGNEREFEPEQTSKLLAENITIMEEKIVKLIGTDGVLRAIELENGKRIELDALFFTIGVERSCTLGDDIGCETYNKVNFKVDEYKQTTVEGVYAIGDLVPGSQLAITSAADGAIAAIAINKSLMPPGHLV